MRTAITALLLFLAAFGLVLIAESAAGATTTPVVRVVTIMEENHATSSITPTSMPYLTSLGNTYAHASIAAVGHPSLPNYFAYTEGNPGSPNSLIGSDCGNSTAGCLQAGDNIFHQLNAIGRGWNGWAESMPVACDHNNSGQYVVHHAPAPYYTDVVPATCQTSDLPLNASAVPSLNRRYTFITPNNADNGHSGSLLVADNWLKKVVGQILAQPTYASVNTLIEITFDEGSGGNNSVYTVFINPALKGKGVVAVAGASHYSVLRLNEELLGLPLLGNADTAPDLRPALGL